MKIKAKQLSNQEKIETLDALYTAASVVKGRDAMKLFLRDLLTESERIMLGRRILIARKLLGGERYEDIAMEMKVGYDTIGRVHQWLTDTSPGYENVIKEMRKIMETREEKQRIGRIYGDRSWRGSPYRIHAPTGEHGEGCSCCRRR